MDADDRDESGADEHTPVDPGPETVDPAPLLGQVGEGATLESGEAIARTIRELTNDAEPLKDDAWTADDRQSASADPEMPIPSPKHTD
jgi:hypothetical protein